nr:tetratricopeptide repeat protein 23 isoform X6 [Oryctolagus cuniculus]
MAIVKKRKVADDRRAAQNDNVYKNMQESEETHLSNHLDEIVAAVSITPRNKSQSNLTQTVLFQPPREKLRLCEEKARACSSSQEYKQAVRELVRCLALTRICYGDSHWKLAEAHINLAQGYLQLKGLSLQAKQHAEKAQEILLTNSIGPPRSDNTGVFKCSVELFHTMGRALLDLRKFKEASENLEKAERLSEELLQRGRIVKEEWLATQARIKWSFAQVCQGQKKLQEALPHYKEALECLESSKGEKSLECVPLLRELAGAEQALEFHDAAIGHLLQRATSILRESLEAKVATFGDLSPEVAETYRLLGEAALEQGNHRMAHRTLKKCLHIQTLLYGPQDKRTLATQQTMDDLAKVTEVAVKPKPTPKAKVAFNTSVPGHTALGRGRPSAAN